MKTTPILLPTLDLFSELWGFNAKDFEEIERGEFKEVGDFGGGIVYGVVIMSMSFISL